jgi:hypothetical protein
VAIPLQVRVLGPLDVGVAKRSLRAIVWWMKFDAQTAFSSEYMELLVSTDAIAVVNVTSTTAKHVEESSNCSSLVLSHSVLSACKADLH